MGRFILPHLWQQGGFSAVGIAGVVAMLRRLGYGPIIPSETARMCAWGIGRSDAAVVGMFELGGLLSWMSFFLPQRVQLAPQFEASWCSEGGYCMLGGTLVLIRGHCVVGGVEAPRRCVF